MFRRETDPGVPFGLRFVNRIGHALDRLGVAQADLAPDTLIAAARRKTGLHDLGPDDGWREGLDRLRASYEAEGDLSFVGRHALRVEWLRLLTQRLLIQDELTRHPDIADVPIERPVFILGFPRTGTTVLHNLLACDAHARTGRMWEMLRPSPAPAESTPLDDPRIRRAMRDVERAHQTVPDLLRIHPLDPLGPDECFYLFGLSFQNRTCDGQAPCPSYMRWLMDHDMRPAYRTYRRVLQLLSYARRRPYWVLKAPTHLFHLDALLDVFPDARIVQTHRDPRAVAGSCCSLYSVTRQLFTDDPDPLAVGRAWLDTWAEAMDRALAVRAARPDAEVHDVRFADFVPDPRAAALDLQRRLGIDPAPGTAEAMARWLADHRRDRHGRHVFDLRTFGLDADRIAHRFADYIERFDLAEAPR